MKHLREYSDDEIKGAMDSLEDIGLGNRPDVKLDVFNFFEEVQDYPLYSDVTGPACEMSIDDLIEDFKERVRKIPKEDQEAALAAIRRLWTMKTNDLKRI